MPVVWVRCGIARFKVTLAPESDGSDLTDAVAASAAPQILQDVSSSFCRKVAVPLDSVEFERLLSGAEMDAWCAALAAIEAASLRSRWPIVFSDLERIPGLPSWLDRDHPHERSCIGNLVATLSGKMIEELTYRLKELENAMRKTAEVLASQLAP
eukprot:m51a1_g1288 hypothetical protein (155) ;mRNA; f:164072-167052